MDMNAVNNVASELQNGTPAAPVVTEPQTLADVIGAGDVPVEQQPTTPSTQNNEIPQQEPGWYQGRMLKERAKWQAEHQTAMEAMEAKQNALLERIIARDAQDLVASGEFKSVERATEYLRMKEGLPVNQQVAPQTASQPRDAQGRFASPAAQQAGPDQTIQQRASELVQQAETIRQNTGIDVMEIYNTNPTAKKMVLSGMDFNDVLNAFGNQPKQQRVPAPVRSANGVAVGQTNIGGMTAGQFSIMNRFLADGGIIDMR